MMGVHKPMQCRARFSRLQALPCCVCHSSAHAGNKLVVARDPAATAAHAQGLDLIVKTVAAPHDLDACLSLPRRDGTMVLVGGAILAGPAAAAAHRSRVCQAGRALMSQSFAELTHCWCW